MLVRLIPIVAVGLLLWGCAGSGHAPSADPYLAALATAASGDDASPAVLPDSATLDDYLRHAARENRALRAAFHRWEAAAQRARAAGTPPDPRVSYSYFVREVETRLGPQRHRISLVQSFPWFGTLRHQRSTAAHEVRAAAAVVEQRRLELFHRFRSAWYEAWYLRRSAVVVAENLDLARYLADVVEARYRSGTVDYSRLLNARMEVERFATELADVEDRIAPLKARMNADLNRPADAPIAIADSLERPDALPGADSLAVRIARDNPELRRLREREAAASARVNQVRAAHRPTIGLGIDYVVTDPRPDVDMPRNGEDPLMAMVSLNVPIWLGGNRAREAAARAEARAASAEATDRGTDLRTRLEGVLYRLRDAERRERLTTHELLPRARQSLEVSQAAFEAGREDFLDVIYHQRTLLRYRLDRERARVDRLLALSELETLLGAADQGDAR